ncbi:AP2-like ethylene-responsive transcription factor BBM2 [Salvia hispanica]|uniref:AP2-like ethylene-responsive transcription factor BBM2 n=1 Tax=Salvia hispanica TaxID=49212 RepID=UPI00200957EC|nr:AP2-like ethylene-responsive transcription factor BBM2 [Salvia hispanica]
MIIAYPPTRNRCRSDPTYIKQHSEKQVMVFRSKLGEKNPISKCELRRRTSLETGPGSSNISAASSASLQPFPEVKRRKRHRRMHVENQEPCIMRGVYFKNLKWQAAIKADNKQIHLGTVGSQEEAARLYDSFFDSFLLSGFILAEVKRRKRHRRKHVENQEPCIMRGVYFKNLKWQATIKVDKKQIHLGTVGSQEEAARLYDRATFMCGRDPNFELSEEEKQELRKFNWDEFLAITNKKNQRHGGTGPRRMLLDND